MKQSFPTLSDILFPVLFFLFFSESFSEIPLVFLVGVHHLGERFIHMELPEMFICVFSYASAADRYGIMDFFVDHKCHGLAVVKFDSKVIITPPILIGIPQSTNVGYNFTVIKS